MFPGADADRDSADYVVVGAPLDVSTTFQPGARFGPERVRRFARTFDDYDRRTDSRFTALGVHDRGDVRAWDDAAEYLSFLEGVATDVVRDGAVPVLVGGEHTVTAAGARAADPDVLVTVDAHLDLRDAYDGNPLSHACVVRRLLDGAPESVDGEGTPHDWTPMVEEVIVLGARTGSEEEWVRADSPDVTAVPPDEVADWEPAFDGRDAYLSVDVDGLDPGFAPGTGTMEPFGLATRTVGDVVRAVAPSAVGFDVVEVNDRDDGQAAALAGKLLRAFVYEHANAK
ncbi:MAG: arginase family protein [Halobacteriales archaeon]